MNKEIDINNYFEIFKGRTIRLSKIPKVVKPAIDILMLDGTFVAQKRLWDKDEDIIMVKPAEPPDLGV